MARCRYNIDIVAAMFGQLDTFVLKLLLWRPLKLLEIVVSHETTIIKSNWFVFKQVEDLATLENLGI